MTVSEYTPENSAFVVFLTSASYTAGVLLLQHSIHQHSKYPLVVAVTPGLTPDSTISFLQNAGCTIRELPPLLPPASRKRSLIAERFRDTWTKLRIFEMDDFKRLILIDADMMLKKNMDELFTMDLPENWIAASHACVCNKERSSWASDSWIEENCAFTPLTHPTALTHPTPSTGDDIKETYHLLNSGLVVLHPSKKTFSEIEHFLNTSPTVDNMDFPDQDMLAEFYYNRWAPLGWQYNALKTMKDWHAPLWRDEEVKNVHYIVEKPWERFPIPGDYCEETESWWWTAWNEWEKTVSPETLAEVKKTMKVYDKK